MLALKEKLYYTNKELPRKQMKLDPNILAGCLEQDRRAQSQLYKQCYSMLMGVSIRYMKQEEEARSMVNQGFLKILTNLDKYQTHVPFEAWCRRIMINTVIDAYRKEKRYKEHINCTDFEDHHDYEGFIDLNEAERFFDAEAIEQIILRLPEMSRQVFNLFAVDGYSHKEISKMLGISEGTSKWHVSTARKQIKEMMATTMNLVKR